MTELEKPIILVAYNSYYRHNVATVFVFGLVALFLLCPLFFSQRLSCSSCETTKAVI